MGSGLSFFAVEEGLEYFSGGDGVEAFFLLFPGKLGLSELLLGAETAQPLILKVYGNVEMGF